MHALATIVYKKGVILAVPYENKNGAFFAPFIRTHFNIAFGRAGPKQNGRRLFVMDNDPSQKSKRAKKAVEDVEAELLELPPRCADIHCLENLLNLPNLIKCNLEDDRILLRSHLNSLQNEFYQHSTISLLRKWRN